MAIYRTPHSGQSNGVGKTNPEYYTPNYTPNYNPNYRPNYTPSYYGDRLPKP